MKKKKTNLYIVRHGESEGNVHTFVGSDPALTEKGKKQAKKRGEELSHVSFSAIYCSTLIRAQQTAEFLRHKRDISVIIHPNIHELVYGELFTFKSAENEQYLHDLESFFYNSPEDDDVWDYVHPLVPGMESYRKALNRFIREITLLAEKHKGETILIVSHGNLMESLLVYLGKYSFKDFATTSIHNTAYIELVYEENKYGIKQIHGIE